jgi:hypothetical protein
MIGLSSREPAVSTTADAVAALLAALHAEGFVVGPDDASRALLILQGARVWPQERTVRALKALLARTARERARMEELATIWFQEGGLLSFPPLATATLGSSFSGRVSLDHQPSVESKPTEESDGHAGHRGRELLWQVVVALAVAVTLVVGGFHSWQWLGQPAPPSAGDTPLEAGAPNPGPSAKPEAGRPEAELPDEPPVPCDVRPRPTLPAWPFSLASVLAALLPGIHLVRSYLARVERKRSKAAITRLSHGAGPRAYRLRLQQPVPALERSFVREAAFQLSAPSGLRRSPLVDLPGTLDATARAAGKVELRYGVEKEHRPILFLEDASPAMLRWPDHGRQLADALSRHGAEVRHFFLKGHPREIYPSRILESPEPLLEALRRAPGCRVVVFTDGAAWAEDSAWRDDEILSLLKGAVWLHPRPPDLWSRGARRLAAQVELYSLPAAEALRRLPLAQGGTAPALTWRLPEPVRSKRSRGPASWLGVYRAFFGDSFWLLAATALLGSYRALDARSFWGLRRFLAGEGGLALPLWEVERLWEVQYLSVASDGTLTIDEILGRLLLELLEAERPDIRQLTLRWLGERIQEDLTVLEQADASDGGTGFALVTARILAARAEAADPRTQRRGRQALDRLSQGGLRDWVLPNLTGAEQRAYRLRRREPPGRWSRNLAAVGLAVSLAAVSWAVSDDLRSWGLAVELDFQVLTQNGKAELMPGRPIYFCDRSQIGDEVWLQLGNRDPIRLSARSLGGAKVWSLAVSSDELGDLIRGVATDESGVVLSPARVTYSDSWSSFYAFDLDLAARVPLPSSRDRIRFTYLEGGRRVGIHLTLTGVEFERIWSEDLNRVQLILGIDGGKATFALESEIFLHSQPGEISFTAKIDDLAKCLREGFSDIEMLGFTGVRYPLVGCNDDVLAWLFGAVEIAGLVTDGDPLRLAEGVNQPRSWLNPPSGTLLSLSSPRAEESFNPSSAGSSSEGQAADRVKTISLPLATEGQRYEEIMEQAPAFDYPENVTVTVSRGALPKGLQVAWDERRNRPQFSGTPLEAGDFSATILASRPEFYGTNSLGDVTGAPYNASSRAETVSFRVVLSVKPAIRERQIAVVGVPVSDYIGVGIPGGRNIRGLDVMDSLPPGLRYDYDSAAILGTPTTPGFWVLSFASFSHPEQRVREILFRVLPADGCDLVAPARCGSSCVDLRSHPLHWGECFRLHPDLEAGTAPPDEGTPTWVGKSIGLAAYYRVNYRWTADRSAVELRAAPVGLSALPNGSFRPPELRVDWPAGAVNGESALLIVSNLEIHCREGFRQADYSTTSRAGFERTTGSPVWRQLPPKDWANEPVTATDDRLVSSFRGLLSAWVSICK